MDELEIKGKKYISSKRAAAITGYAKDYIGQLARAGKIVGTRMGRAWYVEEATLLAHAKSDAESAQYPVLSAQQAVRTPLVSRQFMSGATSLPSSWAPATYFSDDASLMPIPVKENKELRIEKETEEKAVPTPSPVSPISDELGNAIRIKILQEREWQVAKPAATRFRIAEKAIVINKKRKSSNHALAFGALGAALVVFVFFSSGLFLSSNIEFSGPEKVYTANVFASWQYFQEITAHFAPIQQGVHAIQSFFTAILQPLAKYR